MMDAADDFTQPASTAAQSRSNDGILAAVVPGGAVESDIAALPSGIEWALGQGRRTQ